MEGGFHHGRWHKKDLVGTVFLLMFMFVPTLALLQQPEEQKCLQGEFHTEAGICCNMCHRGFKLVEECDSPRHRSTCIPCPAGEFREEINYARTCKRCSRCKASKNEIQSKPCTTTKNTECICKEGFYRSKFDSVLYDCLRCQTCQDNEKEVEKCTPTNDTVCECIENHSRVKGKCELCKSCTAQCKHLCSLSTKGPEPVANNLLNIIGGVSAVTVVTLVLVVVVTHMATKRCAKRKLQNPASKSSEDSVDSCKEVLIQEVSLDDSVKAAPISPMIEQDQPSNLPDCVPLEIKIPELIYMVLDLVPALQVKQLVRSLGVKDTDIEQAVLDHRACKEAHYQMLRTWAERGSRAGGMLHLPLMQELLDELRKMHLGGAAEELETKYSIQ